MPQPDHRPPFRVVGEVARLRVWEAIEANVTITIACDACHHEAVWTALYMRRKLARWKGATFIRVAAKLRCGGCRSEYLHVYMGAGRIRPSATTSNSG